MRKIGLKKISNNERFNEIAIEKSNIFLDNLQDFLSKIKLVKLEGDPYEYNGKKYDRNTFDTLFYKDSYDEIVKRLIDNFEDGEILRYNNREIELLIIILQNKIKLIFYCDLKNRKKIINALSNFVNL